MIQTIETERDAIVSAKSKSQQTTSAKKIKHLVKLKSITPEFATVLVELPAERMPKAIHDDLPIEMVSRRSTARAIRRSVHHNGRKKGILQEQLDGSLTPSPSSLDIGGIARSRGIAATDAQLHRTPVDIERNARTLKTFPAMA